MELDNVRVVDPRQVVEDRPDLFLIEKKKQRKNLTLIKQMHWLHSQDPGSLETSVQCSWCRCCVSSYGHKHCHPFINCDVLRNVKNGLTRIGVNVSCA